MNFEERSYIRIHVYIYRALYIAIDKGNACSGFDGLPKEEQEKKKKLVVGTGRRWLRLAAEKALCRALTHVMRSMWNCAANRVPSLSGSYDM